jgi:GTP-binding protein HflX
MLEIEAEPFVTERECILLLPYPSTEKQSFLNTEMRLLVKSANYLIREESLLRDTSPLTLFSKTRLFDVKVRLEEFIDPLVIVGGHLTAKQHLNLENLLECDIVDKFELVLEIFAQRAMTEEAKVQIELARLVYESPRERVRLMDRLSIGGAWQSERTGFWGTGENPLHIFDARTKKREAHLKQKLLVLKQQRIDRRLSRKRFHHDSVYISVVGYTSAGKSTLLNTITDTSASKVSSRLFETLDTRIRSFQLDDLKIFVTDTVGFIEDLPTFLIDSFRSTLEESVAADIVLLVVDGSESSLEVILQKLNVTVNTLNEISSQNNRVIVINKIDLLTPSEVESREKFLKKHFPEYKLVSISAQKNTSPIIQIVKEFRPKKRYRLEYSPDHNFRSFCHDFTIVEEESFGDRWMITFSIRKPTYGLDFLKQKANSLQVKIDLQTM